MRWLELEITTSCILEIVEISRHAYKRNHIILSSFFISKLKLDYSAFIIHFFHLSKDTISTKQQKFKSNQFLYYFSSYIKIFLKQYLTCSMTSRSESTLSTIWLNARGSLWIPLEILDRYEHTGCHFNYIRFLGSRNRFFSREKKKSLPAKYSNDGIPWFPDDSYPSVNEWMSRYYVNVSVLRNFKLIDDIISLTRKLSNRCNVLAETLSILSPLFKYVCNLFLIGRIF